MARKRDEKFEYLFLDIEWNQKAGTTDVANREPIQFAAIATDGNLEIMKHMSRAICVEDAASITDETCERMHTTREGIMQGLKEADVFDRLRRTFPHYRHVVVWDYESYVLYRMCMRRSGMPIPHHKVIIMQELLDDIVRTDCYPISFETALAYARVPHDVHYLHYAKRDVDYLHQLFRYVRTEFDSAMGIKAAVEDADTEQPAESEKDVDIEQPAESEKDVDMEQPAESETVVVNERSRLLHAPGCRYVTGFKTEQMLGNRNLIFVGYRPCKHCKTAELWQQLSWDTPVEAVKPVKPSKKNKKKKNKTAGKQAPANTKNGVQYPPLTDANIHRICKRFGLTCSIVADVVSLRTSIGTWRIYLDGDKVQKVFHGNYRIRKSDYLQRNHKCNKGYHVQEVHSDNFFEVVRYISNHDKYLYNKDTMKKSRLDYLFEQIEQERNGGEE